MFRRFLIPVALVTGALTGLAACSKAPEAEPVAQEEAPSGIVIFPEESRKLVKFATASVELTAFTTTREAPGQITSRPEAQSVVHAPLSGHLVKLHAKVGDRVDAGAPLATLSSAALGSAQAEYLKAKGEAELARRERNRQRGLVEADLGSKQELDAAEQRDAAAQLTLSQAKEELRVLGLDDAAIASLSRIDPKVILRAPMAGTIVERHAAVGQYVVPDAADPLFELLDLRTVRVEADLPERDFLSLSKGLPAKVTLAALPGSVFAGKVVALSPTVQASSRTGQALIDLPNPDGKLKPGMTVTVGITLDRSGTSTVPTAALQREGERSFVYVPLGGDRYEEVQVRMGEANSDVVELLSGPAPGTAIVTLGSFDLRSQARKEQFGGDH
ncbi:Cobalt-zinc-cadmium resistance protein CzcB [compost metagenome]